MILLLVILWYVRSAAWGVCRDQRSVQWLVVGGCKIRGVKRAGGRYSDA